MTAETWALAGHGDLECRSDPDCRRQLGLAGPTPIYVGPVLHVDQEDDPEHPDRYFIALGCDVKDDPVRVFVDGPDLLDLAYRILARLHPAAGSLVASLAAGEATQAGTLVAELGGPRTVDAVLADLRTAARPFVDPADPIQVAAAKRYIDLLRQVADSVEPEEPGIAAKGRRRAALLELWTDPLRVHLAAAHAAGFALTSPDIDPVEVHEHEHDGPGTIRNHDRGDRSYTLDAAGAAVTEILGMLGAEAEAG